MTKARSNASAPAAKGQIVVGTGTDASGILSVGSANQVLTVDSSTATGLKWAAASSGPTGFTLLNTGGTSLSSSSTSITGLSAKQLLIIVDQASSTTSGQNLQITFNNDTDADYTSYGNAFVSASTWSSDNLFSDRSGYSGSNGLLLAWWSNNAASTANAAVFVDLADTTGWKRFIYNSGANAGGGTGHYGFAGQGFYEASAAITSVQIKCSGGTFDNGTVYVLGAN